MGMSDKEQGAESGEFAVEKFDRNDKLQSRRQRWMNAGENQIVVYQPNATVRLVYGRMLIDNWATAAFDLPEKKRRGVKEAA